jgi:hypothetical protein
MSISINNISNYKTSKSTIDFSFDGSPFGEEQCFDYQGQCFEDLRHYAPDPDNGSEFRVVLSDDEYDYVEDEDLIKQLREAHK